MYYTERNMKSTKKKYEAYERLKGDCEKSIEKEFFKNIFCMNKKKMNVNRAENTKHASNSLPIQAVDRIMSK